MEDNERPSRTYKLRAPGISDHALYFTVVGESTPEAFFINSKELESFQWITSLMTSYHRRVKQYVDNTSMIGPIDTNIIKRSRLQEIINDMKETFDPNGSYIIPDGTGREVHSVVHHLGLILENHCKTIPIS